MTTTSTEARHIQPDALAASITILLVASIIPAQASVLAAGSCSAAGFRATGHVGNGVQLLLLAAPVMVFGPARFLRAVSQALYRQRGQLRTFLRRATIWSAALTVAGPGLIIYSAAFPVNLRQWQQATLVIVLAYVLFAVILHHFLEALFSALRRFTSSPRCISAEAFRSPFFHSSCRRGGSAAETCIIGYGAACFVSVFGIAVWRGQGSNRRSRSRRWISQPRLHAPLRTHFGCWFINLFCHLFGIVDRYMLVHYSGLEDAGARVLHAVDYRASRVIRILFLSVADLLGGAVMHTATTSELGLRRGVAQLVDTVLKVAAVTMLTSSMAVLSIAPVLFHVAFDGRFDRGLAVMPWTMTYCMSYSLLLVAQNYAWCCKRRSLRYCRSSLDCWSTWQSTWR